MVVKKIYKRLNKVKNNWDAENNFYQFIDKSRLIKFLNHFELFKKTSSCKGDIVELGVLIGNSLIRFATFRDYLNLSKKKIIAFDNFGSFPKSYIKKNPTKILKQEKKFAEIHDKNTGYGHTISKIKMILKNKKITNFKLIKGDIFKTLDFFIKKNKKLKISFLHLDLDVYAPTLYSLRKLYKYVSKNGIILIDDFKTHPGATNATKIFLKEVSKKIRLIKNLRSSYYIVK